MLRSLFYLPVLIQCALLLGGCTTTDQVVASWRGYPIEDVIAQWGDPDEMSQPPATHLRTSDGTKQKNQVKPTANRWYQWSYEYEEVEEAYTEFRGKWDGDEFVGREYTIPEKRTWHSGGFTLQTDENGLVESGDSYDSDRWLFFEHLATTGGRWGRPRE